MKRSADELNSSAPPIVDEKEKDGVISIKGNSESIGDIISNPPLKKTKSDSSVSPRRGQKEEVKEARWFKIASRRSQILIFCLMTPIPHTTTLNPKRT